MTDVTPVGESTRQQARRKRQVPSSTTCIHCRRSFWAPKGWITCPRCGKQIEVTNGVEGSMAGFFKKLLEGIAISGGISQIDVSYPYSDRTRRSTGLSDAWRKVISETPRQERATEGRNREKKLQGETKSAEEGSLDKTRRAG
jgi:hypothetical protein